MTSFRLAHRITLAAKVLLPWIGVVIALLALAGLPARGEAVTISGTGLSLVSGTTYHPVAARADLSIQGSLLTIVLANTSPRDTTDAADALSSFYFDIVRDGVRPSLTSLSYLSADGPLFKVVKGGTDLPFHYLPPTTAGGTATYASGTGISDLRAFNNGDQTWQFREMHPAADPFLGFGIGTVANSLYSSGSNGFDRQVVGYGNAAINFSIGHGDVEPAGKNNTLIDAYLVRNTGTFTFQLSGTGWTDADIRREAVFGFGTSPDGTITVAPEPSSLVLALAGTAAVAWRQARRRRAGR